VLNKKTINFDDIVEDEELEDERFKLAFQPGELDDMLREKGYMEMIRQAMIDYRKNYIPGEKIYGVFMTGGASRMDFLKDLICECWGVEKTQIYRDNDPSLTISEGVAEVARMDLRTEGMDEGLQEAIIRLENSDDIYHSFIDIFGNAIFENVTNQIEGIFNEFGNSSTNYCINDLTQAVDETVNSASHEITDNASAYLEAAVMDNLADIQKKVESIVKNYARNDATIGSVDLSSVSVPSISSINMGNTMKEISNSISASSSDWTAALGGAAIGGAIALLLGGPLAWLLGGGAALASMFFGKTEEEKRAEAQARPLDIQERVQVLGSINWDDMKNKMANSIHKSLTKDHGVRESINKAVRKILQEYKETLKDARILID